MDYDPKAVGLVVQEARALLTRLDRVQAFALNMPMVPAATVSPQAQAAIEQHMLQSKRMLRKMVHAFLNELHEGEVTAEEAQRRFAVIRLKFNAVLTQFDIFGDVLSQRSEHGTGVWISGLDCVAADALQPVARYVDLPPVICHLDRGIGAAIRRARTRLPGGGDNPVGIIRIPRERMVGSGIASSLVHEVGHQGAALIDLVSSLRPVLIAKQHDGEGEFSAWHLWERWISEIVADFWSLGLLGITATQGLLAVVSLPRPFVFRITPGDPHPFPWFRVKLGCAMGDVLYPDPQWQQLSMCWERMYPRDKLEASKRKVIDELEETMPEFIGLLIDHKPEKLNGENLASIFPLHERKPERLRAMYQASRSQRDLLRQISPTLAFAVVGQARADEAIDPEQEGDKLAGLLTHWAARGSLDTSIICSKASAWNAKSRLAQSKAG